MNREQEWEGAVEMVEFTGRVLKDAIKAVHHQASAHTPSLTQAISFSRSAFIEAQEYERKCFETMNDPEVDPNQTVIPTVEFKNTQEDAIVLTDEVNGAKHRLLHGETCLVVDREKTSWVLAESAEAAVALEPAEV